MAKETKIRRVKASATPKKDAKKAAEAEVVKKTTKAKKPVKKVNKPAKNKKTNSKKRNIKAPKWLQAVGRFFGKIFGPFGRYVKGAWEELRVTKWPNRRSTWSLTLAVIIFAVIFAALILSLDNLFDWLLKLILDIGEN